MAFFSIVIPTYNREAFIAKAIDSVLSQTFQEWELIVVDDASTDNTLTVLQRYEDPRILIVHNEKNIERSASRNKGIALAQGEYICFLDSDDYFLPDHLSCLAKSIKAHAYPKSLFHTGVEQHDLLRGTQKVIQQKTEGNAVEAVIVSHIPVISVAIHKDILTKFSFDRSLRINEDVYLFAQIAAQYPIIYIPQVTVIWVLHGSNTVDQEKDYLTPQLIATRKIVKDKTIAPHLSSAFRYQKYFELYKQLVYFHAVRGRLGKAFYYTLKGIWTKPLEKDNQTNAMNVIYHLPGGQRLKRMIHGS